MTPIEYVEKIESELEELVKENVTDLIGGVYDKFPSKDKVLISSNRICSEYHTKIITLLELLVEEERGKIKNTKDCGSWCYCSAHSWNDKCNDTIKRLEEIINKLKEQI